jgi:hypothetical protein
MFFVSFFYCDKLVRIMERKTKPDLPDFRFAERILGLPLGPLEPVGPVDVVPALDRDRFIDLLNGVDGGLSATLTRWVDEWLDSGRTQEGVDDPRTRDFKRAHNVDQAAYEFTDRQKVWFMGGSQNLELWLRQPFLEPEDLAREQLVLFLLSNLRFKLAKCRREGCGQYFVLKHWKRTYRRGTVCGSCQRSRSLESAAQATAEDRRAAQEKLYTLAAKRFRSRLRSNDNWAQDAALNEQLIEYLNSMINASAELSRVYRAGVTKKWLGWAKNRLGIETAVRGKDGKDHGAKKTR